MQDKALKYSADSELKLSQIKDSLFDFTGIDTSRTLKYVKKNNIWAVIEGEDGFNYKFLTIKSKPYIIYYKWNLDILNKPILWIVWPRKHSWYSEKVLEKLFDSLVKYDVVTISGMAPWVDQLCHNLSIKHNIPTIAVLWWGIGYYLRWKQRHVIDKIVDNWWLVISEFKIDLEPTNYTFPQRNRIIAWLSDVLFLPEAGENSGSLITVDFAMQMRKKIYGTPNDIFSLNSAGLNKMIAEWYIQPVYDFDLFLNQYFTKSSENKKNNYRNLTLQEQKIITILSENWPSDISQIVYKTSLSFDEILQLISVLEMDNYVYQDMPGLYQLSK